MRKRLLTFLCLLLGMGGVIHAQEYEIGQRFTDLNSLVNNGTLFMIVNETDGKALCFGLDANNKQNMNYDTYANAFSSESYTFKLEKAVGNGVTNYFYLRPYEPNGNLHNVWEYGGYFNSQPANGGCCFDLGLNNQNGQDGLNLAVWNLEASSDGEKFALKNIGTGKYLKDAAPAKYDDATYFTLCRVVEGPISIPAPAGQTDVTSTHLTNADFSAGAPIDNNICTYGKDMEGNNTTYYGAQPINGWTNASVGETIEGYENSKIAGGLFAYGSTPWLGGSGTSAPAWGPTGNAGNAAGLCAVWGGSVQYTQNVTLSAGSYTIRFKVFNASTNNGSGKFITTNLFGFKANNGTEYYAPSKTFAIGKWSTITVTFKLTESTAGKISMGYVGPGGNGDMPHLFVDNVKILKNTRFKDVTNKVGLEANTNWKNASDGMKGSVTTDDGRNTGMAARYGTSAVGTVISQTIEGLDKGTYEAVLFAYSQNEWNNNGASLSHDAGDVGYVMAEGKYTIKEWINARRGPGYPAAGPGIYSLSGIEVGDDGKLTLGYALGKANQTEWHAIQIKSLIFTKNLDLAESVAAYNTALTTAKETVAKTDKMAASVKQALANAINTYDSGKVSLQDEEALEAATDALKAATDNANKSIASYAIIASGVVSTSSPDGWTCTNANVFHINTWSVEGNSDGTGMTTPFIENWISAGNGNLGAGTFSYTIDHLEPGEVYYAQALIRAYSEAGNEPNGPNFFINNVETDMTTAGTQFEFINQYNQTLKGCYATMGGTAVVGEDGKITLGARIANNANYNWVAFKNVSIRNLNDVLNEAVAEADSLYNRLYSSAEKTKLKTVVDAGRNSTTVSAIENAIQKITEAIAAAKKANRVKFSGKYYVQNATSKKYMAAGNDYGTRAIVNETGLDIDLTADGNNEVTFDTNISNGGNNNFLGLSGDNIYMDQAALALGIEQMSEDTYSISYNKRFIGVDNANNLIWVKEPTAWKFITEDSLRKERIATLAEATAEKGVDATWLLQDPNFNRNDQRVKSWKAISNNKTLGGGKAENSCSESHLSAFNISQNVMIDDAPVGIYELQAQGFYRQEDGQEDAPVFFINDDSVAVAAGTGSSMDDASTSFTNNEFQSKPIRSAVTSALKVGITGKGKRQLVFFDNFRLTYYGPEVLTPEELIARATKLAADDDAVAVGKLRAAIKAFESDNDEKALQTAMNQFVKDNADQENDQTAKVATDGWKKFEGEEPAGVCQTQYAPAIDTYDGRKKQKLAENYETTTTTTGQIIYQNITGLQNGQYKVGFYGNAFYTSGRGFDSDMEDGAEDVAYVFANKQREFIVANIASRTPDNNYREFTVEVKDGTIKLGMGKAKAGTNWHTMQIYRLSWFTTAKEIYAEKEKEMQPVIAIADSLIAHPYKMEGKDELSATVASIKDDMTNRMLNISDLEKAIASLKEDIEKFKKANRVKLEGRKYFVQYVQETDPKMYMAAGSKSGTRAIVNEIGLELTLVYNINNNVMFDSKVLTDGKHFLGIAGDSLCMDVTAINWNIEKMGEDTYYISDDKQYIGVEDNNLKLVNEPVAWKFVTMEERKAVLDDASESNPVDATFLLQNPNFNRNDQRPWTVVKKRANSTNLNGGNNENNCAESYQSAFTISQALNEMPIGDYGLMVQGFYRQDEGLSEPAPKFFLNDDSLTVNKLPEADKEAVRSMAAASAAFSEGKYDMNMDEPIKCSVYDGTITIGITGTAEKQWVCFDNFRLYYYGLSEAGVSDEPKKKELVYTGKPQVIIEPGSHVDDNGVQYTMQYSKNKDDQNGWTTDVNEMAFTEAGRYTIWYRAVNAEGYPVVASKPITVNIEAAYATDAFEVKVADTDYTYDGTAKEPEVTVTGKLGNLEAGKDYTIAYKDNTNAGKAKVVVTGLGNYRDEKVVEFNIAKLPLTSFVLKTKKLVFNELQQTVEADSVMAGEMEVPADAYTLSGNKQREVGKYTVTLTAKESSNFVGSLTAEFVIEGSPINVCNLTLESYKYVYNAKEQKPAVTVIRGNIKLTEGKDYTVAYKDNVDAGTAKVTITGIGNYAGTKDTQFTIVQGVGNIEMLNKEVTMPYNAGSLTVKPMVILGDGPLRYTSSNDSVAKAIFYSGELFINNVGQTTITVIMTSTKNVTADTTSFVLTVVPASATLVNITRQSMGYGIPTFKVSSNVETLVEGKDYTLSYRDLQGHAVTEEEMLAAPGRYVVVANLKGNYEGTQELEFKLTVDPMTGIGAVTGDDDGTVRYDMNGRRVQKTHRGMVIENGKKRYIKK